MMNWEELQENLRVQIKARRGAQAEIARRAEVSRASVSEYVNGDRNIPVGHISHILSVLDIKLSFANDSINKSPEINLHNNDFTDELINFKNLFLPEEIDATKFMTSNHKLLIFDMPHSILSFFRESLSSIPKNHIIPLQLNELISRMLLGRIMQDIRAMSICASMAYPSSTASIAAGIFEISFELIFIMDKDEEVKKWVDHTSIKNTSSDIGKRITNYVDRLGLTGKAKSDMFEKYFLPYRIISMAKHGNSVLLRNQAIKFDKKNQRQVIASGPDGTGNSLPIIALSLEIALSSACLALARFYQQFYPDKAESIIIDTDMLALKMQVLRMQYPKVEI